MCEGVALTKGGGPVKRVRKFVKRYILNRVIIPCSEVEPADGSCDAACGCGERGMHQTVQPVEHGVLHQEKREMTVSVPLS